MDFNYEVALRLFNFLIFLRSFLKNFFFLLDQIRSPSVFDDSLGIKTTAKFQKRYISRRFIKSSIEVINVIKKIKKSFWRNVC